MVSARPLVLAIVTGALAAGCGAAHVAGPTVPGQTLVALLPDSDTGITGRAVVSNDARSIDLAAPRDATLAMTTRGPSAVKTLSQAEVDQLFGEALSALPPPARHFTLFFRFESDELTDESRALVPEILRAVKDRPDPEVAIVGHTDTMGQPRANVELGQKRAMMVHTLLMEAGLHASTIEVTSHGEGDLLVRTPDDTPEPRNRRVEISVK